MLQDREREAKDTQMRQSTEVRGREEEKGKMLGDIHNMIRQYKDEKKVTKAGGPMSNNKENRNLANDYSAHSSVYY